MTVKTLAEEIKQDLLRKKAKRQANPEAATRRSELRQLTEVPLSDWRVVAAPPVQDQEEEQPHFDQCFMCGGGMTYRGTRFCTDRCRDDYDSGAPGYFQHWRSRNPWQSVIDASKRKRQLADKPEPVMRPTTNGYMIACAGCGEEFESRGLRCCSASCERRYRDRESSAALLAEVGADTDRPAKRKCQNPDCGTTIPTWRAGRRVSAATKYCSPRCKAKAHRNAQNGATALGEPASRFVTGNGSEVPVESLSNPGLLASRTEPDRQIRVAGAWAIATDQVQWVLQHLTGETWEPVAFVRSTRDTLAWRMSRHGVRADVAERLLEGLPDGFDTWLADQAGDRTERIAA